ncbi:MAG: DUF1934 domain-containing protein [Mollicutes bacterium]|nr:DUF1934 domain-containing protein [Mollicutes bacterium]
MPKIKIYSTLNSPEGIEKKEIIGILENDIIIYKEDSVDVTIQILDNKIKLNRKSKEYDINMNFIKNDETIGNYIIDENMVLDLKIKTNILEIKENKIIIEYELIIADELVGTFNWVIDYEVI